MQKVGSDKGLETILNEIILKPKDVVKVTQMNHIIELQHMEKMNRTNHIQKIDKDRYVDKRTGEIKEFVHSENRQQNYNSLRQTFKRLRYLINNNFVGSPNELHMTLTYKENMTDTKRLYSDFNKFVKRLKYAYKTTSSLDYLCVVEPQARGAWHCHVLIRFNELDKIFIKNAELRSLWGLGFVKIKSLQDVDNIGAYLSAYLTDIAVDDLEGLEHSKLSKIAETTTDVLEKQIDNQTKKVIKGGRLSLYPSGMNLYRKSKGIEVPERIEMRYEEIEKVVGSAKPHYSKSFHIENDDFENTISFLQYNTKRND